MRKIPFVMYTLGLLGRQKKFLNAHYSKWRHETYSKTLEIYMENKIPFKSYSEIYSVLVLENFEYISTGQPTFKSSDAIIKMYLKEA